MADSATYLFCLVQSARVPPVRGAPQGLPGAGAPRAILIDRDIWAIVADAPLDRFSAAQLEKELQDIEAVSRHALAHAAVVEFFFRRAPVIPLKLFTLFSEDERARRELAGRAARLRKLFASLRGLEEWGVRIAAAEAAPPAAPRVTSGRDYLQVKKLLQKPSMAPSRATRQQVRAALRALERAAVKTRKDAFPPPRRGRPYVTGASFLVKATRRQQWKKLASQLTRSLGKNGHRLELSGPWPPYRFVS